MDENKISFVDFIDDVEAGYELIETIHWHGKDVQIKKVLDLSETIAFVSDVIDACFTSNASEEIPLEETNIVYTPELKKFAIDYMTIAHYTNIDLTADDGEDEMHSAYNFIAHSDIVDQVLKVIDLVYYGKILEAIDEKIKFINDSNILEMTKEFAEFNDALAEFGPAMSGIAQTFGSEEFQNMFEKLSKTQENNTLMELAKQTAKSNNDSVIQFAKSVTGDDNGRES